MTDRQNKNLQYSVIDYDSKSQKDFINKMRSVMDFQKEHPNQVHKTSFNQQDASGKRIFKIQLSDQLFIKCNFYTSRMTSCVFTKCEFRECNFSAADINVVKFINCTFNNCNFTDAKMQDVDAKDCKKINCNLSNINFVNNVYGFGDQDYKIIQDSIQNTGISENKSVYQAVKKALSDWNEVQQMSFELVGGQDQNCGLAIYPNPQKNGQQQQDYWQFVFFYGNQSVLMNDFNLYGMGSEQIKELVNRWKTQDLVQQSQTIIKNILTIIQD